MKICVLAAAFGLSLPLCAGERPWQRIVVPSVREAAAAFRTPSPESAMTLWWFWNGPMREADIVRDLDDIRAHGVKSVLIWAYYGLEIEYLSDTWFERVRFAVAEARRRDLRVWLMDEGSYPSGFAGGKFTRDHPEQRMKALVASPPAAVEGGKPAVLDVPSGTLAAWAVERESKREIALQPRGAQLQWTPPQGKWEVRFVHWTYRTPATRYVSNPGFPKNADYSLFDFLDPEAARRFLDLVHERYRRSIGAEFGRTVLGFMSDESDCAPIPWTARSLEEFRRRKGYDLQPHAAKLVSGAESEEARRVQADYYDVWSGMLRESFFRTQAEWCEKNGLEYIVHLNSEDDMRGLVRLSGDYFRSMRHVHVPGVDAIWRQIWPGTTADFPKFASSAAHLFGRPRAFTESYAVYGRGLSLEQAKWVMDHQHVRGINLFQVMLYLSDTREHREYFHPPDWRMSPQWSEFPALANYANRAAALLSLGTPAARVALFFPTANLWLGDDTAYRGALDAARRLLEAQQDFDFIDEQALAETAALAGGGLRNLSGQVYRTVLVPAGSALSRRSLERLRQFAAAGGRAIFLGAAPRMIYDRTFRDAVGAGDLGWATIAPSGELPALPASDVTLDRRAPALKYLHRTWRDAELYFFFNEAGEPLSAKATLEGAGEAQAWDAETGAIRRMASARGAKGTTVALELEPGETRFVVVGQAPDSLQADKPRMARRSTVQELGADWKLEAGGRSFTTPLKAWSDLGIAGFSGTGVYRKQFSLAAADLAAGNTLLLELGEVRCSARVRVNGVDLGARSWRPFRWDATRELRAGANTVEIEVRNTAANELAGDPERLRQVEQKGWLKNSYIRVYRKFDEEMVPSGLLGPVRIAAWSVR